MLSPLPTSDRTPPAPARVLPANRCRLSLALRPTLGSRRRRPRTSADRSGASRRTAQTVPPALPKTCRPTTSLLIGLARHRRMHANRQAHQVDEAFGVFLVVVVTHGEAGDLLLVERVPRLAAHH